MHDEPNRGGAFTPADADERVQAAIFHWLLEVHPAQLSVEEVVRAMTDGPPSEVDRDDVERALRDLGGAGLLHRHGSFVFASRPAVRAAALHSA